MGKFPVVFLSFGKITGRNFEEAKNQLKQVICE